MIVRAPLPRRRLLLLSALGGLGFRTLAAVRLAPSAPSSRPHTRTSKRFVIQIRTSKQDQRKIIQQRGRVRQRVSARLEKGGLQVLRMPNAGSYAKHTGLRRYMYGRTRIGGAGLDLPFVLSAASGDHSDYLGA